MKKAILLVAYGAGNSKARAALRVFEHVCRSRFPSWPVRWAYSSRAIRETIARERQKSDSVKKALMRFYFEKFTAIAVQPLQTIPGCEYCEVCRVTEEIGSNTGMACVVGEPLLTEMGASNVAMALIQSLPEERGPEEDVVFMGHGAGHPAAALYSTLAKALNKLDERAHLGTMSGSARLEDILPRLKSRRVWLLPLLSVAGRHALRDMAGPHPQSWMAQIEARGHSCRPVLKGTSEYEKIGDIWLGHLEDAIRGLSATQ